MPAQARAGAPALDVGEVFTRRASFRKSVVREVRFGNGADGANTPLTPFGACAILTPWLT